MFTALTRMAFFTMLIKLLNVESKAPDRHTQVGLNGSPAQSLKRQQMTLATRGQSTVLKRCETATSLKMVRRSIWSCAG